MENVTNSKAGALFNFLLDNFDPNKKLGELTFRDIMKIIEFLDSKQCDEENSN